MFRTLFTAALFSILSPGLLHAAPVTINNASFEAQIANIDPPNQGWTDNLEPDWKETGGPNSPNAFMERLGLTGEDGTDTLGMALGHDVWQDLSATYQPNTLYTLNVLVGNRSGLTDATNQSVYGLALNTGAMLASGAANASTLTAVGSFAEAPAMTFDTYADPCAAGQAIRVLLQARGGANRSHFDLIRLDASPAVPGGRPAATLDAITGVTVNAATLNGTIIAAGSAAPTVVFYYDTSDKGGNPASWTNNVPVAGTQTGSFSANVSGLAPSATYYVRARVTNASGAVWAAPCRSFTTLATAPVVENVAASGISGGTATVGANVTTTGGQPPNVTIYYGTADGGTTAGAWASSVSIPNLSGTATSNLTGLVPATPYYFRAYAQNGGGSDWADSTATFTTVAVTLPAVENRAADNITGTSAVLRGEVTVTGNEAPVITLYWGTADGGTNAAAWANSRVLGPDAGDFDSMVQGLSPLTTYFFTSRAVNAAGTAWASPSRSFATGSALPTSVIINEIHYDPADVTKRQEYIEFHNPTGSPIDMSGWVIDDGVTFTFPSGAGSIIAAGGNKVVAENTAAYTTAFPSAGAPVGQWTAGESLSNSGERIRLRDAVGNVVDEVDYKSGFPWPTAPKGGGVSCELIHPHLNNEVGGNWRAGSTPALTTYVPFGSAWRWRRGVQGDTGEPTTPFTAWRFLNFTEPAVPAANAQWSTGQTPLGFGDNDGNTANALENTTLLTDMNTGALYYSVYMRKVFTIPAGQVPSQIQIRAKSDDGCIVWINGIYAGSVRPNAAITGTGHHYYNTLGVNAPEPAPTDIVANISAASVNLVAGDNVIAVHGLQSSVTSSDFFIDAEVTQAPVSSNGVSPNGPNTVLAADASVPPPAIRGVEHTPNQPAAGQAVVVSATITDPNNVGTVSLTYQTVDPGTYVRKSDAAYLTGWTSVTMNDAGTGGDAVAGDAVFSATVPASVQTNRRLVRYRITAADTLTNAITVPYADDEQPNFAYFVYNGVPAWTGALRPSAFNGAPATAPQTYSPALLNSIQPYHLIANATDVQNCQYTGASNGVLFYGTMIYDGVVYDHIQYKNRGIGSTYVSGKNKWNIVFTRARNFEPRDNWGRKYKESWNNMPMDANASPWASVHRGAAGVEEAASYRSFELAGMTSLRTHYVHWRIIDDSVETSPASQYDGDLWGLYLALEPTEGNLLDERNLPDGNLYAIEGNGGDKKHQSATQINTGADWTAYAAALTQAGQTEAWYRANVDLPAYYTFLAMSRLIGNVDVRPGDNYRYYHRPAAPLSDDRWSIIAYDLDMQFIAAHHWGGTMNGVVVAGAANTNVAIMRHPALALEFRNRCRELLSLMASDGGSSGGQIGQLVDEYAQMVNPAGVALTWADLDAAMWNLNTKSLGGGANTGQTSHRGNFWRANYLDGGRGGLGGTIATGSWVRSLADVDTGYSNHESLMQWFKDYATNTYPPAAGTWLRRAVTTGTGADSDVNRQKGYGYKYLEWESIYGGFASATTQPVAANADLTYPNKPTITYSGVAGFPVNDLTFTSGNYSDPNSDAIAAVQFRIGEISAPSIPLYDATVPRIYEIEPVWTSAEIATASPTGIAPVRVPASSVRVGHTYRARVRHKDAAGSWSLWSEPVQFAPGAADLSAFRSALRVTEINYNPGALTAAEITAGVTDAQNFEFLELRNISALPVVLTDVHFRDAVDYDFPAGFTLAAGASTVVCKNPAAFAIRYPSAVPQLAPGSYGSQNLANSGENIELKYGLGDDATSGIFKFSYDDANGWPTAPDGGGSTLVLHTPTHATLSQQYGRDPNTLVLNAGSHEDPAEWRASYLPYGNPGGSDGYTYAIWAAQNPSAVGPDTNEDKDDLENRLEYALMGDPASSSTGRAPTAQFQEVGGLNYATLTFTRRAEAEDTTFAVQFSDELMTWNIPAVLITSTDNLDGTLTQTWRSVDPVSARSRLFGKVLVTTSP